ncbi:hypothetical protein BDN71DRAFT_1451424, partial [Pleurotus eryngii]
CEPSEGDHEERTSGLAQPSMSLNVEIVEIKFMAVRYLDRWNLESTAIANRCSGWQHPMLQLHARDSCGHPNVPFPDYNLTEHAKEEVSTPGMNQLFKVQGHTTFCAYLSATR